MRTYPTRTWVPGKRYRGRWPFSLGLSHNLSLIARGSLGARQWALLSILLLAAAWPAKLAAQTQGAYQVDTKASHVEIHLFRSGFLSMLGSNHLISLTHFSGTAELSLDKPWWVHMLGEATSLKVLDPWASESERREVADTMLGPAQLNVKRYPSIKLQSSSIVPDGQAEKWRLLAMVTLHGVTRQVEFPLDCQEDGNRLRVRGKADLNLRDFNIHPFSTALGAYKVKDVFEVTYDITFKRNP